MKMRPVWVDVMQVIVTPSVGHAYMGSGCSCTSSVAEAESEQHTPSNTTCTAGGDTSSLAALAKGVTHLRVAEHANYLIAVCKDATHLGAGLPKPKHSLHGLHGCCHSRRQ